MSISSWKRLHPGRRRALVGLGLGLLVLARAFVWIAEHEIRDGAFAPWIPSTRSGDEPHYMVALHSVLYDGDLSLADDYAAAAAGGPEAGRVWRGASLDHHTILIDPVTGRTELWRALWGLRPRPCDEPGCIPFEPKRPHGFPDLERVIEAPAHPPAFSILAAAALWPLSPDPERVDELAFRAVRAVAVLTILATAALALCAGLGPGPAFLAAALLALASPWLPYAKSFFTEGSVALPLVLGLLALASGWPVVGGLLAVVAMWTKPALVVVGAGWILERLLAGDRRAALRLVCVMGAGGLALLAFNQRFHGRLLVAGAQPWEPVEGLDSLLGTLLDGRYGLLAFAPWVAVAALGLGWRRFWPRAESHVRLQIAIPCLLYLAIHASYGALGATCYGPRYWIPFVPWLAVAVLATARAAPRPVAWLAAALALATFATAVPAALQFNEVWDRPPYDALVWLLRGRAGG